MLRIESKLVNNIKINNDLQSIGQLCHFRALSLLYLLFRTLSMSYDTFSAFNTSFQN